MKDDTGNFADDIEPNLLAEEETTAAPSSFPKRPHDEIDAISAAANGNAYELADTFPTSPLSVDVPFPAGTGLPPIPRIRETVNKYAKLFESFSISK